MAFLVAEPQVMATAAGQVEEIGSAIGVTNEFAAGSISGVAAAAGDEVSAAIASFFAAHGQAYQTMAGQVAAFHTEFQQALAQAGNAYVQAEAAGAAALAGALGVPVTSAAAPAATIPPFPANLTTLVMGGTGIPIPGPGFINLANELYVRSANALLGLNTPEELYPLTGTKSLTLDASVSEGLTILDNAIMEQLAVPGNTVTVFGVSQSAVIASLGMQKLAALGPAAPTASQLNFVLLGNEMNPNGGLLARFPDLSIPSLGLTFYGGTPSDTIYPTANYTLEYDGFADFPSYPLNFISDLNAVMDIVYVHPTYLDLAPGLRRC